MTSFSNNAWLPKALFDAGLKVSEVAGWQTRGRRLLTIRGVICHHTASRPARTCQALAHSFMVGATSLVLSARSALAATAPVT
jgi:hypothetical protein